MELRKTNENINRSFNEQGESEDRVESANYAIVDADGNTIGSANISNGNLNANINIYGFSSIAEGEEKLMGVLGAGE